MIGLVGLSLANWFVDVLIGITVGFVVHLLDQSEGDNLIPTFIASIIGAVGGGVLASTIFGPSFTIANFSAILLTLSGAFLLSILSRLLRNQSEQEIQDTPDISRSNSYEYAYFSEIRRPDHLNDVKSLLGQVDFPISNKDLIRHAEVNEADRQDLTLLESLPDHIYQNQEEVMDQLKVS